MTILLQYRSADSFCMRFFFCLQRFIVVCELGVALLGLEKLGLEKLGLEIGHFGCSCLELGILGLQFPV